MTQNGGNKLINKSKTRKTIASKHTIVRQPSYNTKSQVTEAESEIETENASNEMARGQIKAEAEKGKTVDLNTIERERLIQFQQTMFSQKLIGSEEELIPFAWREPLKFKDQKSMSKYFKNYFAQLENSKKQPKN